jgi:Na+/proline symporter
MGINRIWKSIAAGLCGSAAHSCLMILKSWAGLLPSFQPYEDLQQALSDLVGSSVHPLVLLALSYFNGAVVLGFLFGRTYWLLPGRSGAMKGIIFGLLGWIVMGILFFPLLNKGLFATRAGLGIIPGLFSLVMVLTYSITLGIAYSILNPKRFTEP